MSRRSYNQHHHHHHHHDADSPGLDSSPGAGSGASGCHGVVGGGGTYDMLPPPPPPAGRRMVQPSQGYGPVSAYGLHGFMPYGDAGNGSAGGVSDPTVAAGGYGAAGGGGGGGGGSTNGGGGGSGSSSTGGNGAGSGGSSSGSLHRPCKPGPLTHMPMLGQGGLLTDPNTSPRLLPPSHMRHVVSGDPNHSPLPPSPHHIMRGLPQQQQQLQLGDVPMSPHHPMSPHAINLRLADAAAAAAAAAVGGQQMHYGDPCQSPRGHHGGGGGGGHYEMQPPPLASPAAAAAAAATGHSAGGGHYGENCVSPHIVMNFGGGEHHAACSPRGSAPVVGVHYGEPVPPSPHARSAMHYVGDGGSHYGSDGPMGPGPSAGHMTPSGSASYGSAGDGAMHSPHPGPSPVGHPSSAGYHKQGIQQRFFAPNFTLPSDMSLKGDSSSGGGSSSGVCLSSPLPGAGPLQSQQQQQPQSGHSVVTAAAVSAAASAPLRYHSPSGSHNDAMLSAINMSADAGAGPGGGDGLHESFVPDAAMEPEWPGSGPGSTAAINSGGAPYELFTPESEVNDAYKELLPDASFHDPGFLGDTDSNHAGGGGGDPELKKKGKGRPCKGTSPGRYGVQCPVCGKTFNNSSALAKHKLTHSEERKYVCQLCQKAFKRQDHLNGHMMTHRSKKPYECKIEGCSKSYCDARSLRRHLENHHNVPTDSAFSMPIGGYPPGIDGSGNCMYYPGTPSPHTSPSYTSASGGAAAGSSSSAQFFRFDGGSQGQLSSHVAMPYSHGGGEVHWASGGMANLYGSDLPKPVECTVCKRRFKNLPALNGHMRLHGGYMKKDLSDKEKTDESGGEEGSPPPLPPHQYQLQQQQQHAAPSMLQQHQPVLQLPQPQVHDRMFRAQASHGLPGPSGDSGSAAMMSESSAGRFTAGPGGYSAAQQQQQQQHQEQQQQHQEQQHQQHQPHQQQHQQQPHQQQQQHQQQPQQQQQQNMAYQAAASLLSMGEVRTTSTNIHTTSSSSPANGLVVQAALLSLNHSSVLPLDTGGSAQAAGSSVQPRQPHSAGRAVVPDYDGNRIFNFPDGSGTDARVVHYQSAVHAAPSGSSHMLHFAASAMERAGALHHGGSAPLPGGDGDVDTCESVSSAGDLPASAEDSRGGVGGDGSGMSEDDVGPAPKDALARREIVEESLLADRKRHFSADPDKFTSYRHGLRVSPPVFGSHGHGSHSLDGIDSDIGRSDGSGHRERRKSAETPRLKAGSGVGGFREPYPWTATSNAGGSNGSRDGELFTRSDSAVIFRNPSGLPAKGKRKNRPEPLVIVQASSFQSRLRSPCTWEQSDGVASRGSSGMHKSPPPYTPPPILSPVRSGSGLFWSMSGTYRPVTPHAAAPVTPKAVPQRQNSTSSNGNTMTHASISRDTIDEADEDQECLPEDAAKAAVEQQQQLVQPQRQSPGVLVASEPVMGSEHGAGGIDGAIVSSAKSDSGEDLGYSACEPIEEPSPRLLLDGRITPHVNVGPNFQAEVPEYTPARPETYSTTEHAGLVWDPSVLPSDVTDADVQFFQEFACCAAIPGNGCNKEYAMHLLLLRDGSIPDALLDLMNSNVVIPKDHILATYKYQESEAWSREEIEAFTSAILKCDKDFYSIAKEISTKDVRQCVEFYYLWKKVCPDEYKRLRAVRRRRENDAYNLRSRGTAAGGSSSPAKDGKDEGGDEDDTVGAEGGSDGYDDTDSSQSDSDSSGGGAESVLPVGYRCSHDGCSATFASRAALDGHAFEAHACDRGSGSVAVAAGSGRPSPYGQTRFVPSSRSGGESYGAAAAEEYPCKLCGKIFNKVKSRSAHMKSHRQHGGGEKASSPAGFLGHSSKK